TPKAKNDLTVGGKFIYRMESKETGEGFDFGGTYNEIGENSLIKYTMDDSRVVTVEMHSHGEETHVSVTFDLETENSKELQREGWQAILYNFKSYVENN